MLHKCANPECGSAFRKLTQGKLFLVETDQTNVAPEPANWKHQSQRRIEYYWLCDQCVPHLTLAYEPGRGILAVPLAVASPKKLPAGKVGQLPLNAELLGKHRYAKGA
jgi:hypothetical protein